MEPSESETQSLSNSTATSSGAPALLPDGSHFGGYRIVRLLGQGGMGQVYEAEQLDTGRRVALKVLSHSLGTPTNRERFLREGRLAASISHPHTVYVFGSEEIQGTPIIAMELIHGGTLQDPVRREGPMSVAQAVDAMLQVISGLEAAQALGILHRDIKPSNCFVDTDGAVKVGDFGLSISTLGGDETQLTVVGTLLGTPAYASPEQLRGEKLDVRSDIYSVGATLYYLLTGRPPFEADGMVKLISAVLERSPESPGNLRSGIPSRLSHVVLRCLAKQRDQRYRDYALLARTLMRFASAPPRPASLRSRFVAGVLDHALRVTAVMCTVFLTRSMLATRTVETLLLLSLAVVEGIWGLSPGKALLDLRVMAADRNPPGVPKSLLRALLFLLFTRGSAELAHAHPIGLLGTTLIGLAAQAFGTLLLFCSVLRSNGQAALHDLATGTRVVHQWTSPSRAGVRAVAEHVSVSAEARRVGPYAVRETVRASGPEELLLGYDPSLRRRVWIRVQAPGSPPVSEARRDLHRPARLRWLAGRRAAEEAWDVFERPQGQWLLDLPAQPWSVVRNWLRDLAEELCHSDLRAPAALDRVWITTDGRAMLLEFNEEARPASSQGFLYEVARHALELPAPLPVYARTFLQELRDGRFPDLAAAVNALKELQARPIHIARWKTPLAPLAVASLLALAFLVLLREPAFLRSKPYDSEVWPFRVCLERLLDAERDNPAEAEALRIYIAARYRDIVADPDVWPRLWEDKKMRKTIRAAAARALAAHPNPSSDELATATAALQPLLDRAQRAVARTGSAASSARKEPRLAAALLLISLGVLALGLGLVLRGRGVLLETALVSRDGSDASRWLGLLRTLLRWLPSIALPFSPAFGPYPAVGVVVFALGCAWLLAGIPERLTRTVVVPR